MGFAIGVVVGIVIVCVASYLRGYAEGRGWW